MAKPGALLATNTSTLDIDEIATSVKRPQDVIGLHFFSPANVMPLLEVVRGRDDLAQTAIRTAMELAKLIAQDAGARARLLRLHRQPDDGGLRARGAAAHARRRDAAARRHRARAIRHGHGHPGGVRHGGHRRGRQRASHERASLSAGSRLTTRPTPRCMPPGGWDRRPARASIATRRAIAPATTIRRRSPSCARRAAELGVAPARRTPTRKSSSAASFRCSTRASASSKKASRSAPVTSTWSGARATVSRAIAAGRCSTPTRIGLPALLAGMQKYRERFGPMHWEPAPLLVQLVREGRTLADWDRERRGAAS